MSIVSSVIIRNVAYGSTSIKVREEHIDHLGISYFFQYIADNGYDVNAALATHAININQQTIDREIAQAIASYEQGNDPLHYEASANNWQKITPDYQTWDELAAPVTIDFLGRESKLELRYIETTIIRISSQDKKDLWGMTNAEVSDVNADIQSSIDTQAALDLYSPYFVDGVKI